jgi:hypothetical protein
MTIKEIMERSGMSVTGRAVAYIKDALEEIAIEVRPRIKETDVSIVEDTRYYDIPSDVLRITDIRVLNHKNSESKYVSIPRLAQAPKEEDPDGK